MNNIIELKDEVQSNNMESPIEKFMGEVCRLSMYISLQMREKDFEIERLKNEVQCYKAQYDKLASCYGLKEPDVWPGDKELMEVKDK